MVNGVHLTDELRSAIAAELDKQRRYTPLEAFENMVAEVKKGTIDIVDSSCDAPPAKDGECTVAFRFHLKAVG